MNRAYRVPGGHDASPVDLLYYVAHALNDMSLGVLPPFHTALRDRMREPRVGDLVLETSTHATESGRCIGWLTAIAEEPAHDEADWLADGNGLPVPTERIYYLKGLDGTETRWSNASFVAIPSNVCPWNDPGGW